MSPQQLRLLRVVLRIGGVVSGGVAAAIGWYAIRALIDGRVYLATRSTAATYDWSTTPMAFSIAWGLIALSGCIAAWLAVVLLRSTTEAGFKP
jgi:hypothetical protein